MDLCPRSASVRAVEDCTAICVSAANLYKVYTQDLKQFALIQMMRIPNDWRRSGWVAVHLGGNRDFGPFRDLISGL